MPMTRDDVKGIIRERGWTSVDLAARWGISVTWMSRLINQPHSRPAMYDDAFKGLPSRKLVSVEREARHVRKRKERKAWTVAEMFPQHRLFEATDSQIVDEGTQLFVSEVTGNGRDAEICFRLVEHPEDVGAELLLDIDTAQRHFADLCRNFDEK